MALPSLQKRTVNKKDTKIISILFENWLFLQLKKKPVTRE